MRGSHFCFVNRRLRIASYVGVDCDPTTGHGCRRLAGTSPVRSHCGRVDRVDRIGPALTPHAAPDWAMKSFTLLAVMELKTPSTRISRTLHRRTWAQIPEQSAISRVYIEAFKMRSPGDMQIPPQVTFASRQQSSSHTLGHIFTSKHLQHIFLGRNLKYLLISFLYDFQKVILETQAKMSLSLKVRRSSIVPYKASLTEKNLPDQSGKVSHPNHAQFPEPNIERMLSDP